jgi:agmatine deiminase
MNTLRLPAEFEAQRAVWLSWPGNPATWPDTRPAAEAAYARYVAAISRFQPVELICQAAWQSTARLRLREAKADFQVISFHDWPTDDAWCRDHGPLFVYNATGDLEIIDFRFNAWGGKFPYAADDEVPRRVSEGRNLTRHRLPTVGEGGAIEVNSRGLMVTTESVWLNANRNPGITQAQVEAVFGDYLGVKETLWLKQGLIGDDTDGHIDTISRFVDDDTVVTSLCKESDPNYKVLRENLERLQTRLEVRCLPHPDPIRLQGWREEVLPATYANFLILNEAVLVPSYNQPESDSLALGILGEVFAGRQVLGIPCEDIILEGGALHCLSMQEPLL